MNEYIETSKQLLEFIDRSPSCFHVIDNIKKELNGFEELDEKKDWKLSRGKGYYVTRNTSSIIAFYIPEGADKGAEPLFSGFNICAAHSDSPAFKIKPNCEIDIEKHYTTLNVEKYGGMLMAPWMDRPLSVAGRIIYETANGPEEKLINIDRDLLIIPNVAIHMNRDANDGYKYNAQKDMLPLFSAIKAQLQNKENPDGDMTEKNDDFISLIADTAEVDKDLILSTDLFLYNRTKGTFLGMSNELIADRALDDLQCAWALTQGFKTGFLSAKEQIPVCCIFDNEEVGSLTKQGADSDFLYSVLSRICSGLDNRDTTLERMLASSFMISADNAHAVHPNHPEYADPTNRPYLNGGIVIKYNANQKYTTDARSDAHLRLLCRKADIPFQTYTNRSDIAGGSTLGNLSNRHISVDTVDIGLPQLAMHSSYETAGSYDTLYMIRLISEFLRS